MYILMNKFISDNFAPHHDEDLFEKMFADGLEKEERSDWSNLKKKTKKSIYLVPETTSFKWLFQLDDSKS